MIDKCVLTDYFIRCITGRRDGLPGVLIRSGDRPALFIQELLVHAELVDFAAPLKTCMVDQETFACLFVDKG